MEHYESAREQPTHADVVALQPMGGGAGGGGGGGAATNTSAASRRSSRNTASPSPARSANLRQRRPPIADRRLPSIRLRRLPSSTNLRSNLQPSDEITVTDFANVGSPNDASSSSHQGGGNRRRSSSEPRRLQWDNNTLAPHDNGNRLSTASGGRARGLSSPMPPLDEEAARGTGPYAVALDGDVPIEAARRPGMFTRASTAARSTLGFNAMNNHNEKRRVQQLDESRDEYEDGLVDYLDVVDPEIATLSTLTNVQNSLFIPNLGGLLNRRPTYTFTRDQSAISERDTDTSAEQTETEDDGERPCLGRSITITSQLPEAEDHYAVLPHGIKLKGWSSAEKRELNDHVRHMLHSRRAAFKRSMKGFGQYVRRRTYFLHLFFLFSFVVCFCVYAPLTYNLAQPSVFLSACMLF